MTDIDGKHLLLWYVVLFSFGAPYFFDLLGVYEVNDLHHSLRMCVVILLLISIQLKDIYKVLED